MSAPRIPEGLRIDSAHASALLAAVARHPDGSAARDFDRVFYPLLAWYSLKRAASLARRAIRPTGKTGEIFVPGVRAGDEESVAHDTATAALARARRRAHLFRPGIDDPIDWVLRNAPVAYIDVVRAAYGRGEGRLVPTEAAKLENLADARTSQPSSDVTAQVRTILSHLTDIERAALVLHERDGHTYDEIGEMIFGHKGGGKKVDHLLQNARYKLKSLWRAQTANPS
jgi:DNA-directed RNA polymerase specialized sigma24 family protein